MTVQYRSEAPEQREEHGFQYCRAAEQRAVVESNQAARANAEPHTCRPWPCTCCHRISTAKPWWSRTTRRTRRLRRIHHSVEAYHHQGAKLDVRPRVGSSDRSSWPSQAVDWPDARHRRVVPATLQNSCTFYMYIDEDPLSRRPPKVVDIPEKVV